MYFAGVKGLFSAQSSCLPPIIPTIKPGPTRAVQHFNKLFRIPIILSHDGAMVINYCTSHFYLHCACGLSFSRSQPDWRVFPVYFSFLLNSSKIDSCNYVLTRRTHERKEDFVWMPQGVSHKNLWHLQYVVYIFEAFSQRFWTDDCMFQFS